MPQNIAVGIDFGTSNSCVAVFKNAKVEIIATIPSLVAFTDNERLIGIPAKIQESVNPTNTISNIKRLIRHPWSDPISKTVMTRLPFEVINEKGRPKIKSRYKHETKYFCPEEICAMVIARLKDLAEEYLGQTVSNVVISVPASFNYFERLAIRNAATIAGFHVMRTISSVAAAAMTYNFSRISPEARNVLIFDLGGGTTNVSIVELTDGFIEVKATLGHSRLGGEEFDNRLVDHLVQEFKRQNQIDLSSADKRVFQCLKRASQKAKHTLSTSTEANIEIDSLFGGQDFYTTITRAKFEEINADLFCTALGLVREAIKDAKLYKSRIHDVVLIGGSSRIPKIRKLLQNFFNDKIPNTDLNPDEAAAYGAAINASILNGNKADSLKKLLLLDAAPFTLGIEGKNGDMIPVIRKNWSIPSKGKHILDSSMLALKKEIVICEGEHARAQDNNILAKYELPSTKDQIAIYFDIDSNHNISLFMVETTTERRNEIQINYHDNSISKEDIERMISDSKKYRQDDQRVKNATTAKTDLESCCTNIKLKLEESGKKISYYQGLRVMDKCNRIMTWLEVTGLTAEVEEYRMKQKELENFCHVEETTPNKLLIQEFFEQVKCGNCRHYLSCFPVYIVEDTALCGRCSHLKMVGSVRDTLYESLVKSWKFPCIHNMNGCLENLLPVDVQNHERSCSFRTIYCPVTTCRWKGIIKNFLQHFQETHPDAILGKDGQFELYFFESEHHYLFVNYKKELLHFKQTFSVSDNAAMCSFTSYKLKNPDTKCSYRLTLQNGPGTRSFAFPFETANDYQEIKILVEEVIAKLENPSCIIASVNVAPEAENEDTGTSRPQKLNSEVKYDLLAELECPVCFYYITPPIYQCTTGHSICSECKKLISKCPSCEAEFKNTQNFTLEKMASLLTYPCKFADKGCDFVSKPECMKDHHKFCPYGPQKCPLQEYNNCLWSGSANNVWSHILTYHPNSLLESNTINVCIDCHYLNKEDFSCYIIRFSKRLFKLHYLYKEGFFYWAAQLIDSSESASDYRFEIDIVDNTKKGQKMCFRKLCSSSKERARSFDSHDECIVAGRNLLKPFLIDVLTYQVRIIHSE